ncbi:Smr/MutS family protein [Sideroxydans lithotrophicus]|uniref:Smr protein/MutS2 n=1 Tax=Sideroxydans lithotrophicus (strain ES-1) TaxID=580332 RepID=D5CNY0_SIDLE|nr:Smr/MutS family protein [Sideroxydans lithotrophicus]ADE12901.1 Smr protein/MutS2 [Sideroxydans lithotrophicus ES-1]
MKEKPEQDADLFRQALKDVTPLPPGNRIAPAAKPRKPVSSAALNSSVIDNLSDHGAGDIAASEFLRPDLNRMTLRKLRRGEWPPQDEIDLHGLSTDGARKSLVEFLHAATLRKLRCVNVIHGKGWRSEGRDGTLKVHTRHWLTQHAQVLAFCEAPPNAGGGGAVWVLLKSS